MHPTVLHECVIWKSEQINKNKKWAKFFKEYFIRRITH